MKKFAFLALATLIGMTVNAQFKTIAEGPVFDEPEKGFARILQLKNGTTMFFTVTVKDGIDVKVYDAKHAQKFVKHAEPSYGKMNWGAVEGVFEIAGNAVMFIRDLDDRTPILYRLIFDGKTGDLKEDKQLMELQRLSFGAGYAVAFGGVSLPTFGIRKDANSDNYAIVKFNSFESDRNKRIELVTYGPNNQETGRAFYNSPENKYKYMEYVDMAVNKGDVSVVAYAYNTAKSGGKASELILATLSTGAKTLTVRGIDLAKDEQIGGGILRYNAYTSKLLLLATAASEKRNSYYVFVASIDPARQQIDNAEMIFPTKVDEKSQELFGRKNGFTGLPQNLYINADGTYSVVFEEIKNFSSSNGGIWTELGPVAVVKYDASGKEVGSYFVPKNHKLLGQHAQPFYQSEREGTAQELGKGNQFKSFAYLSGKNKSYLLFNDVEENADKVTRGKMTTVQGVGDCDGFYFDLSANTVLPERKFVSGKPESRRENNLALFPISDYDKENNVYVTLKLEKDGRDKGVRLVWLQPQ